VLSIIFPVSAFVAVGFEPCVVNMFLKPLAFVVKAGTASSFWMTIGKSGADFPLLTWNGFLAVNLFPVTLGNIIGGAGMVGLVYWFIYLRKGLVPRS
jgi:formate transporter